MGQLLGVHDFNFCLIILRSAASFDSLGNSFRIIAQAERTDLKAHF